MFKEYQKTITSYAGADMVCSINVPGVGPVVFGELAQISYSVFREKVPVRTLGRVSMKGYTRGMRTITGILGFTVFDESIVYRCMKEIKEQGYRMLMDEMPMFDVTISMANEFGSRSKMSMYGISTYTEGSIMSVDDLITQNIYEFYALDIDPIHRTNEEKPIRYRSQPVSIATVNTKIPPKDPFAPIRQGSGGSSGGGGASRDW